MSFLEYRSYQFQPDKSRGQESDYIVMPNILVLVRYPWSSLRLPLALGGPLRAQSVAPGLTRRASWVHLGLWLGALVKVMAFPFSICKSRDFPGSPVVKTSTAGVRGLNP